MQTNSGSRLQVEASELAHLIDLEDLQVRFENLGHDTGRGRQWRAGGSA